MAQPLADDGLDEEATGLPDLEQDFLDLLLMPSNEPKTIVQKFAPNPEILRLAQDRDVSPELRAVMRIAAVLRAADPETP